MLLQKKFDVLKAISAEEDVQHISFLMRLAWRQDSHQISFLEANRHISQLLKTVDSNQIKVLERTYEKLSDAIDINQPIRLNGPISEDIGTYCRCIREWLSRVHIKIAKNSQLSVP